MATFSFLSYSSIIFYLLLLKHSIEAEASLLVFCDDLCLKLMINDVDITEDYLIITKNPRTKTIINIDLNPGDLITLVSKNDWGSFGVVMGATLGTNKYSFDCTQCLSSNSTIPIKNSYTSDPNFAKGGFKFYGYDGAKLEIKEFYLQIPNGITFTNFADQTLKDFVLELDIDSKIKLWTVGGGLTKNDIKFQLIELPKYGKLTTENGTEIVLDSKYKIDKYKYTPNQGDKIEKIKFTLHSSTVQLINYALISVLICDESCTGCDVTNTSNSIDSQYCNGCASGYYFMQGGLNKRCYNQTTKPTGYGFNSVSNTFDQCASLCADCIEIGNSLDNKCTKCQSGYAFTDSSNGNCIDKTTLTSNNGYIYNPFKEIYVQCTDLYYFDTNQDLKCTTKCPSNYPVYDETTKECKNVCPQLTPYIQESTGKCVSVCESGEILVNNKCLVSCPTGTVLLNGNCISGSTNTDSTIKINIPVNEIEKLLNESVKTLADLNADLKGDNYTLQVYHSDDPPQDKDDVSSINLTQCENVLREYYKYPADEKFIIAKLDIYSNDSLTPQVEYIIYDQRGKKIDMSLCDEVNGDIAYPTSNDINGIIKFDLGLYLLQKGIDIFNISDPFFNDICYVHTLNETDLTLNERRQLYQNYTLCEDGCTYQGVNYTSKKIKCFCDNKDTLITSERNRTGNTFNNDTQYIFKCYRDFFKWEYIKSNAGFWVTTSSIIVQSLFTLSTWTQGLSSLFSNIHMFSTVKPSNPTHQKYADNRVAIVNTYGYPAKPNGFINYFKERLSNHKYKTNIDEEYNEEPSASSRREINDIPIPLKETTLLQDHYTKKLREFDDDNKLIHFADKLNMLYDDTSYRKFQRNEEDKQCMDIFLNILKTTNSLLNNFYMNSKYEILTLKISIYILYISFLLMITALFYTDHIISSFNSKTIRASEIFLISFYSTLISYVILRIMKYLITFGYKIETLIQEVKQKDNLYDRMRNYFKSFKKKLFAIFIIEYIIMFFVCYYITIFCIVFHSNQSNIMKNIGISLVISFTLSITICSAIAIAMKLSLRYKCKFVFYCFGYIQGNVLK